MKRNLLLLLVVLVTLSGSVSFANKDDFPFPILQIHSHYEHLEF